MAWNAKTLSLTGKLAKLLHEFGLYKLDILGISEVRWLQSRDIVNERKIILLSGNDEGHMYGVCLILNKEITKTLIGGKPVNGHIIRVRFPYRHVRATIIRVYVLRTKVMKYNKLL